MTANTPGKGQVDTLQATLLFCGAGRAHGCGIKPRHRLASVLPVTNSNKPLAQHIEIVATALALVCRTAAIFKVGIFGCVRRIPEPQCRLVRV